MKKYFITLLLFFAVNVNASHLISGQIAVKHLNNTGTTRTYEVSITIFRDCLNGQADFDDPLLVGAFSLNSNSLIANLDFRITQRSLISSNQGLCIEQAIYVKNITVREDFYITNSRCCRVYLNNISDNYGITIYTEVITSLPGSIIPAPVYNRPLIADPGKMRSFDMSSPDSLSDSTIYEFSNPLAGADKNNPLSNPVPKPYSGTLYKVPYSLSSPLGTGGILVIDRHTGILSLNVPTIGVYAIGTTVTKFKNGLIIYKQVREHTIISCQGCFTLYSQPNESRIKGVSIFPNPGTTELNIGIEGHSLVGPFSISIFNLEGKLIKKGVLNSIKSIDISDLGKGIYQVQIIFDDKISNAKFSKI